MTIEPLAAEAQRVVMLIMRLTAAPLWLVMMRAMEGFNGWAGFWRRLACFGALWLVGGALPARWGAPTVVFALALAVWLVALCLHDVRWRLVRRRMFLVCAALLLAVTVMTR